MRRVYMLPTPTEARRNLVNSINQIVTMFENYLPQFGYALTENPDDADLIVGHAGQSGINRVVDIGLCHGLYPTSTPNSDAWWWGANKAVIQNLRTARQITVPSEWVADLLRRDMGINPHVIDWGVNAEQWQPGENMGYVLWNKTRRDVVCDPTPIVKLAALCPNQLFLSTFGDNPTPNLKVLGSAVPFEDMKKLIQGAAVYLATVKETWGLSTAEAMLSETPVLGWRWAGTEHLVKHGEHGYLCEPGDIQGLKAGLEYCLEHREILGANARKRAMEFTWEKSIAQFAKVFDLAYDEIHESRPYVIQETETLPLVSVVIPNFQYARFIGETIASVKTQTLSNFECIIVDDGSQDHSAQIIQAAIADDSRFRLILKGNEGVAETRNRGVFEARGRFVCCVDADDKLGDDKFLEVCVQALEKDRTLGIAYTGLKVMDEGGNISPNVNNWPPEFDFEQQAQGKNQVPTCCVFRRDLFMRAGGYRKELQPAEDAGLWLRIGMLGYGAKRVTSEGMFHYRLHGNSLSTPVRTGKKREPNWREFPWIKDGQRPFASLGNPRTHSFPVRNYDRPVVSIIIPVGPSHGGKLLRRALDSIEAQTVRNWECIVIDDGGGFPEFGYAWIKRLSTPQPGSGAAAARNIGLRHARGNYVAFLDADDYFLPEFLVTVLRAADQNPGRYVYTDWLSINKQGLFETHYTPEYTPAQVFNGKQFHSINILIKREDILRVGGFDESFPCWEDTDLFMNLAKHDICGIRAPFAMTVYDYTSGTLREHGEGIKRDLQAILGERYAEFKTGAKVCNCGKKVEGKTGVGLLPQSAAIGDMGGADNGDLIRCEYKGGGAYHTVTGYATKTFYGRRRDGDVFYVRKADVEAQPETFIPVGVAPEMVVQATETPPAPNPIA